WAGVAVLVAAAILGVCAQDAASADVIISSDSTVDVALRRGDVVWGYPAWRLAMPADAGSGRTGLPGAVEYALRHPWACTRLAVARVLAELNHVRPFYSTRHNAALL